MRRAVVLILLTCSCAERPDLSGTFVGAATGSYRLKDGMEKSFTAPSDEIVVKTTSRHYQDSEIEVTVRGCVLATHGNGGGKSWSLSSGRGGGTCTLDVPSIGPVSVKASGGLTREGSGVHLMFFGDTDKGDSVRYSIDATPKK
jgi:hypothetical protein